MAKCSSCGQSISSRYVREGSKGLMRKVGFYCPLCDLYYDPNLEAYTEKIKT